MAVGICLDYIETLERLELCDQSSLFQADEPTRVSFSVVQNNAQLGDEVEGDNGQLKKLLKIYIAVKCKSTRLVGDGCCLVINLLADCWHDRIYDSPGFGAGRMRSDEGACTECLCFCYHPTPAAYHDSSTVDFFVREKLFAGRE